MKKFIYLFLVSIMLCGSLTAQSELTYRGGVVQDGVKLKADQVRELMSYDRDVLKLYNSGRSLLMVGQVIALPSACMLGWDLGQRLGGAEGNGTLLAVGAIGTAVGLLIALPGEKKIKNSVKLYNSNVSKNTTSYQIEFGLTPTGGVGLCMRF